MVGRVQKFRMTKTCSCVSCLRRSKELRTVFEFVLLAIYPTKHLNKWRLRCCKRSVEAIGGGALGFGIWAHLPSLVGRLHRCSTLNYWRATSFQSNVCILLLFTAGHRTTAKLTNLLTLIKWALSDVTRVCMAVCSCVIPTGAWIWKVGGSRLASDYYKRPVPYVAIRVSL